MPLVTAHLSISLDGFVAGPDQCQENPLGIGGHALHTWHMGEITHEADQAMTDRILAPRGAYVMGRNMFGPVRGDWDAASEDWRGWWGDEPPYHAPVFVLTHHPRDPIEMDGGTTFHFVGSFDEAFAAGRRGGGDETVTIAGGASAVRQGLEAGVIDEILLNHAPVDAGQRREPVRRRATSGPSRSRCTRRRTRRTSSTGSTGLSLQPERPVHVAEQVGVALQVRAAVEVHHLAGQPRRPRAEDHRLGHLLRRPGPAQGSVREVVLADALDVHRRRGQWRDDEPGETALARMPRGPSSSAATSVSIARPALAAQYAAMPAPGCRALSEVSDTTDPPSASTRPGVLEDQEPAGQVDVDDPAELGCVVVDDLRQASTYPRCSP